MATRLSKTDTLFTTSEAAEYMGFEEDTVRQYVYRGLMRGKKMGPIWLLTKSECDRYLREKRSVGNPGNQQES